MGSFKGERPQADQLYDLANTCDVKAITVTVGANDLDWAGVVDECVRDFLASSPAFNIYYTCASDQDAVTAAKVLDVRDKLHKTIDSIVKTMDDAHYARNSYRLIVQGYIAYVAPGSQLVAYNDRSGLSHRGCPLADSDADWFRTVLVPRLNSAMYQVVEDRRQLNGQPVNIQFLDRLEAFKGHELCNRNALPVYGHPIAMDMAEWANKLNLDLNTNKFVESLHPNYYGQLALQQCLALMYATAGDQRCTAVGTGSTQVTLSPLPTVWSTNGSKPLRTGIPTRMLDRGFARRVVSGCGRRRSVRVVARDPVRVFPSLGWMPQSRGPPWSR